MENLKLGDSKQELINLTDSLLESHEVFWVEDSESKIKKKFVFYIPTLATLMKVSKILLTVDLEKVLKSENLFHIVDEYGDLIMDVISILLSKGKGLSKEDIKFIKENITPREILELFTAGIKFSGVGDFQKSIIAVQTMSLMNSREIIARFSTLGN